jgi:intein/homing endonuclease
MSNSTETKTSVAETIDTNLVTNSDRENLSTKYSITTLPPFDTMGLFTFLRTYARRHNEEDPNSTIESWEETLDRVVTACETQLKCGFTKEENKELFNLLYNLKCSVAGRFLWQLGTRTVDRLGLPSLQNCSFTTIDDPVKPFVWTMNFLMLGSGVGYRVLPEDIKDFPEVKKVTITRQDNKDADFIVPDSREGWVKLLGKVLKAHFYSGKDFSYSCLLLRSKGAPIKGFGGLSSGPEVLCDGLKKINDLLNKRAGTKIRPVDALDIMNIIGMIVVSGNVRRCIPKGSLVHTREGMVPIENVKVGTNVLTSVGYKKVKNTFVQGKQKIITIVTSNGTFSCTANHKMAINENDAFGDSVVVWKEAGSLKPGEKLIAPSVPIEGKDTRFSSEDMFHLGLQCYIDSKSNVFSEFDELDSENWLLDIFKKVTNFSISERKNFLKGYISLQEGKAHLRMNRYRVNRNDNAVEFNLLRSLGILGTLDGGQNPNRFIFFDRNKLDELDKFIIADSEKYERKDSISEEYVKNIINKVDDNKTKITPSKAVPIHHLSTVYCICPEDSCGPFCSHGFFYSTHDHRQETYDIEVEDNHEFFCEGFLTHNSAQICIGDCKDKDYLQAKRWDLGNIPNWRAFSNNSVVCNDIKDIIDNKEFWEGYEGKGEPYGLINLELSRKCGRLGETQYPDPEINGYNPCLTGDTLILTTLGLKTIEELKGKQFTAIVGGNVYESTPLGFWSNGVKQVFKITLDNDLAIKATSNHKFLTGQGWKKVYEITDQDDILLEVNKNYNWRRDSNVWEHAFGNDNHKRRIGLLAMGISRYGKIKASVRSIEVLAHFEEVYDCTIPEAHCFSANGMVSHNCAEQSLCNYETCVSGDTLIHTYDGLYPIKDLVGKKTKIFNGEVWSEVTPFLARKSDSFIKVTFSDGSELKVTPYHEFAVSEDKDSEFTKTEAKDLKVGMYLPTFELPETQTGENKNLEEGGKYLNEIESNTAYYQESIFTTESKILANGYPLSNLSKKSILGFVKAYSGGTDKIYSRSNIFLRELQILLRRAGLNYTKIKEEGNFYALDLNNEKEQQSIVFIEDLPDKEPSYCFSEPLKHMGVFGNVLTYQCCLSDIFLPNVKSKEELFKCATYLYRICKHSLSLPCVDSKDTEDMVHKNYRFGIGITGYLQSTKEQQSWLSDCYVYLRELDKKYSQEHSLPTSIKMTTVKPSGTLSILANCTPGVHPGFSRYYKRRVRIASESPLIKLAKEHGYPVEYVKNFDDTIDHSTQIITFPKSLPDHTVLAENCTAVDQLEYVKKLQTEWSDNSVSVTVYYRKCELPAIKEWLRKNYNDSVKTVSFLLHSDHNFKQAPMEAITKEEYDELVSECRPITNLSGVCFVDENIELLKASECAGGHCPLR